MKEYHIRGFRGRTAVKGVCCPRSVLCYYRNCYISISVSLNFFCKSGEEEGMRRTDSFQSTARAGSTF